MSEFAEKKALKAQIAAAKKAGKSMQTVGKLQYKLNQLMKTKQKGKPVKRKTPLTGSPSAGTGTAKKVVKKKAGGKMSDLVYDKPKGKGTGIVKSTAKTTPYKAAKIKKVTPKKVTPKKVGYTPTNPKVLENLSAAAKKQAENERLQAARRKLSTAKKVKERQKDYRNNRNTSY
jgi:hypothetical protein|tara:strand:+ start:3270 stop:3791 length:522 start_codon:yes stop_codon:yes gene_type:complete